MEKEIEFFSGRTRKGSGCDLVGAAGYRSAGRATGAGGGLAANGTPRAASLAVRLRLGQRTRAAMTATDFGLAAA